MSKTRVGEYSVRYASETDHKKRGYIYTRCGSLNEAINAADMFLQENELICLMLHVVSHTGEVVEEVSRD